MSRTEHERARWREAVALFRKRLAQAQRDVELAEEELRKWEKALAA